VAHYLQEVWEVAPNAATSLAALAGGNLQEAIDLIDAHENANAVMIREWMEPCFRQHVKQLFAWNDQFLKLSREQQKNFFRYCLHFFREVLLLETGAPQLTRLTEAERRTAEGLGKVLGVERLMAMLELFDKCIYFVERNVNGKIMMSYVSVVLLRQFNKQIQTTQPFYDRWAL
jgi:DNA polymerase-3 subunit delta'